jgi:hypothetical protein
MANSITIQALNLCVSIAHGFATHDSNRINGIVLNPSDPDHLHQLHQTSLRTLFIILVTLHLEEKGFLPSEKSFRDELGIYGLRAQIMQAGKHGLGKKLSIIKRIRETAITIFSGDNVTPFKARLFDPNNNSNQNLFKWKFYDSDIADALVDLFLMWPEEGTSLIASGRPDTNEIIEIYSYLLDFEPKVTDCDVVCLNNGKRVVELSEANQSDKKRGKVAGKGCVIFEYAKSKSRKGGTVYTPDEIVNRIVRRTVGDNVGPIRILDPSCGTGRFLAGAIDYLVQNSEIPKTGLDENQIIKDSIFGIDQDELAIELAEVRLMLRTHSIDNPAESFERNLIAGDTLCGIDSSMIRKLQRSNGSPDVDDTSDKQFTIDEPEWRDVWRTLTNSADQNSRDDLSGLFDLFTSYLSCEYSDFLSVKSKFEKGLENFKKGKPTGIYQTCGCCYPEISFPHLYYSKDGNRLDHQGFDIVIGNPPYGDILDDKSKSTLKNLGYKSGGGGNNDIFRFFVERGLHLLKQGGMLGFILPNTFLKGRKYGNFRKRIIELSYPEEILDFDLAKIFERDVFTAILTLRKKPAHRIEPVYFTSLDGSVGNLRKEPFDPVHDIDDSWLPIGDLYLRFRDDSRYLPLEPYFVRIGDVGINYQRKNVGWTQRTKSRIADEIFYEGDRQDPKDMLYLKGEDIERFSVKPKMKRWLRHDFNDRVTDGEIVNVNLDWAMRPVKIVSRQTGDSIIAAVDRHRFLTGRSLHTTLIRDTDYSPHYIVALMNSSLITSIFRELTREQGRPLAQVKLSFLRRLPIKRVDFALTGDERRKAMDDIQPRIEQNPSVMPSIAQDLMQENHEDVIHDMIVAGCEKLMTIFSSNGSNSNGSASNGESKKLKDALDETVNVLYGITS